MFGSGLRYHICQIPISLFEKIKTLKNKYNISYEELFFDLEFINKLGFAHWSNFYCINSHKGFYIHTKNRIEIRKKNKLIKRFFTTELLNEQTLFNLYKTSISKQDFIIKTGFVNVVLIELETGMIFNYKLDESMLEINSLEFNLLEDFTKNSTYFLSGLHYKNEKLNHKKEDSVCRSFKVIIM
jgi:hypothetical protein